MPLFPWWTLTLFVVSHMRARSIWSIKGISLGILLEVSLLDQPLDLFLELVTVFGVVPFDSMKLPPSSWFKTHYIYLQSLRHRDGVHVKDFTPDLFTASIQRRKFLCRLAYSLEYSLIPNGICIITLASGCDTSALGTRSFTSCVFFLVFPSSYFM